MLPLRLKDMKPANIMWFGPRCRWKLIDMDGLRAPSELVDMQDAESPACAIQPRFGDPLCEGHMADMTEAGSTVGFFFLGVGVHLWPLYAPNRTICWSRRAFIAPSQPSNRILE